MSRNLLLLVLLLTCINSYALDHVILSNGENVAGHIKNTSKSSVYIKTDKGVKSFKFVDVKEIHYESGLVKYYEDGKLKVSGKESNVAFFNKEQRWDLVEATLDGDYTIIRFNIQIIGNAGGCMDAHYYDKRGYDIYISGDMGRKKLIDSKYTGDYRPWEPLPGYVRWEYFSSWQKGKSVSAELRFPRVPLGVQWIDLHFNGGRADYQGPGDSQSPVFDMKNIFIENNDNAVIREQWDEESLKEYWSKNKIYPMEGIYSFLRTSNKAYWGTARHRFGIKKEDDGYHVIYLNGANNSVWSVGELKGMISATKTRGYYKVDVWYQENKQETPIDFYVKYYTNALTIYDMDGHVETDFIKVFPQEDIDDEGTPTSKTSNDSQDKSVKATGSGFFVGGSIIATNEHVVSEAAKIEVVISNSTEVKTYEVKVLCIDKTNDLALLQIIDKTFTPYNSLPYSIARKSYDAGASVFSMGYPHAKNGMGEEVKITDGIISSKTGFKGDVATYQISAPIQPGNSGGPLFDKQGNLVGITSSGIVGLDNVGYAIKSAYLYNLMDSAPITISDIFVPQTTQKDLPDLIKEIRPYVVMILTY